MCADPGMPQFGIQNNSQGYQVMRSTKVGSFCLLSFLSPSASEDVGAFQGLVLGSWRKESLCLFEPCCMGALFKKRKAFPSI